MHVVRLRKKDDPAPLPDTVILNSLKRSVSEMAYPKELYFKFEPEKRDVVQINKLFSMMSSNPDRIRFENGIREEIFNMIRFPLKEYGKFQNYEKSDRLEYAKKIEDEYVNVLHRYTYQT